MGSGDFVEQDVQLLCKQLFPVVKYFQFSSFSDIDHPSCLTRGVLCDLSQVSLVTNDYNLSACWFYWYNLNLLIELQFTHLQYLMVKFNLVFFKCFLPFCKTILRKKQLYLIYLDP